MAEPMPCRTCSAWSTKQGAFCNACCSHFERTEAEEMPEPNSLKDFAEQSMLRSVTALLALDDSAIRQSLKDIRRDFHLETIASSVHFLLKLTGKKGFQ
jgi:hypothetical protein